MKIEASNRLKAHRSQDWYSRMTPEQRAAYLSKYPGTKFHHKTTLAVPASYQVNAGLLDKIRSLKIADKAKQALVKEMKHQVDELSHNMKCSKGAIVKAFKEPKMANILEATGYSFTTVYKAFKAGHAVAHEGALHVIAEFAQEEATHKGLHHASEKAKRIDALLEKYPVMKKVSGPALAGLMLYGYAISEPSGLDEFDLSKVKLALKGEFGVSDFLNTNEATNLGTHVATGKVLSLTTLAENASSLALGLTYTVLKESGHPKLQAVASKLNYVSELFRPKKSVLADLESSKGFKGGAVVQQLAQDRKGDPIKEDQPKENSDPGWWNALSEEAQSTYLEEHPNSKYHKKAKEMA